MDVTLGRDPLTDVEQVDDGPRSEPPVPFVDLGAYHARLRGPILEAIDRVIASSAFVLGPAVVEFEAEFAAYCGARHAVGVDSGTAALTLALRALDLGPGDEVIAPANTFVASVEAIVDAGAAPRLVDVDPGTFNIDPELLEAAVTPRTRAIMVVHLYGQPAPMDRIREVAERHRLTIIEDACQAHGARHEGVRAGVLGDIACFSFYPGKNLGALGDGGAVVTNDDKLAERVRRLRNHGGIAKYEHQRSGTTSRLDSVQAAVLSVKLPELDERNERRRILAQRYSAALSDCPAVTVPASDEASEHVFHLYVIRTAADARDGLARFLGEHGISTGVHYPTPVHILEAMHPLGYSVGDFPVSEQIAGEILSLPMYPELEFEQVDRIAGLIRSYFS